MIWKELAVIINCLFTTAITYHNSLHGFQAGCGTGTATLEVNLLQQIAALREAVLNMIFQDLHKAYNALDRSMCLGILEGCRVGTRHLSTPLMVLGEVEDSGTVGRVLWITLTRITRGHSGRTIVAHYFQCGG